MIRLPKVQNKKHDNTVIIRIRIYQIYILCKHIAFFAWYNKYLQAFSFKSKPQAFNTWAKEFFPGVNYLPNKGKPRVSTY